MRTLVCGACALIAICLMVVSATLSYRWSYSFGGTPLEAQGYGIAAAGVDILKGFLPFVIFLRLREGRRLAAAAGLLVFAIGVIWSFISAMGLAAQVRMEKVNTSDNRQASYREAKALLARIEAEQVKIARKRSAAEITGDIDGKLAAAFVVTAKVTRTLGALTEQCARPTRGTAESCAVIWKLRHELAAAREWERLEADARGVRERIEILRRSGAGDLATADAQAEFLARAIGVLTGRDIDQNWMRLLVVVLLGILLEVGSSCGLYVALGSHALPMSREMEDSRGITARTIETGNVKAYCIERLKREQGARVSMGQVYADYDRWCVARKLTALPRKQFLLQLRGAGESNGWSIAGGVIHHVRLWDASEADELAGEGQEM